MLSAYCNLFYASHYLPIAYYDETGFVSSAGFPQPGDPYPFALPKLLAHPSPAIYVSSDTGYYGLVRGDHGHFVLGPAYSTPVTREVIAAYLNKNAISPSKEGDIAQFLGGIPQYTYNQFLNLLVYLHFTLTGEVLSAMETFGIADQPYEEMIGAQHAQTAYEAREEQRQHGTYFFERQLLDLVRRGETERLNTFLMASLQMESVTEGKLADSPLRQAKNLFIGFVATVGKEAAIPGGLDVEETYQLIDTYTMECERMHSEESVKKLQYNMLIDFCNRVAQHRLPEGVSGEVYSCMQFIANHVNEAIGIPDVVAHSGRSRAGICDKFKKESGMSIGEYITASKIREAKSLLRYTDKDLGEIAEYLCFSSQPYFQNVFKKHVGCTPTQYRLQKHQ